MFDCKGKERCSEPAGLAELAGSSRLAESAGLAELAVCVCV